MVEQTSCKLTRRDDRLPDQCDDAGRFRLACSRGCARTRARSRHERQPLRRTSPRPLDPRGAHERDRRGNARESRRTCCSSRSTRCRAPSTLATSSAADADGDRLLAAVDRAAALGVRRRERAGCSSRSSSPTAATPARTWRRASRTAEQPSVEPRPVRDARHLRRQQRLLASSRRPRARLQRPRARTGDRDARRART